MSLLKPEFLANKIVGLYKRETAFQNKNPAFILECRVFNSFKPFEVSNWQEEIAIFQYNYKFIYREYVLMSR